MPTAAGQSEHAEHTQRRPRQARRHQRKAQVIVQRAHIGHRHVGIERRHLGASCRNERHRVAVDLEVHGHLAAPLLGLQEST
jgi:hypothetical protein